MREVFNDYSEGDADDDANDIGDHHHLSRYQ